VLPAHLEKERTTVRRYSIGERTWSAKGEISLCGQAMSLPDFLDLLCSPLAFLDIPD